MVYKKYFKYFIIRLELFFLYAKIIKKSNQGAFMKKYLLPPTGKFYKACLHIHSNLSDGKFSPEELKKLYMEQGFSVIAYTDHEFMLPHNDLSDDNFIALTSGEFSVTEDYTGKSYAYPKTYHINVYSPDKNRERTSIFSAK